MASPEARIKKLEKKAAKAEAMIKKAKADAKLLKADLAKAKKAAVQAGKDLKAAKNELKEVVEWIELQVLWTQEVTQMLRMIDWAKLAIDYSGAGGTNPPQTPPDWPPQA